MTGTKKTRPVTSRAGGATINCGQQLLSTSILHRNCPKVNQFANVTTELARLRAAYNGAILANRWADAAELQRRYHAVEKRRRQQLLAQAREVTCG